MDTIISQLRKIQALAERGQDGEKAAAQRLLEKLLAKHGLTLDALTDTAMIIVPIPYRDLQEVKLIRQIYAMVIDTDKISCDVGATRKILYFTLRRVEAADLIGGVEHYLPILRQAKASLRKALRSVASAVIQQHNIFPPSAQADGKPLTPSQIAALLAAMRTVGGETWKRPAANLPASQLTLELK